jgi:hypothetical protein
MKAPPAHPSLYDAGKSTLRLVKVNQQTLFLSDRPQRIAGHLKMGDYLEEWSAVPELGRMVRLKT